MKSGSSFKDGVRSSRSPSSIALLARLDVEIPEDLQVVGDEADRGD